MESEDEESLLGQESEDENSELSDSAVRTVDMLTWAKANSRTTNLL